MEVKADLTKITKGISILKKQH